MSEKGGQICPPPAMDRVKRVSRELEGTFKELSGDFEGTERVFPESFNGFPKAQLNYNLTSTQLYLEGEHRYHCAHPPPTPRKLNVRNISAVTDPIWTKL